MSVKPPEAYGGQAVSRFCCLSPCLRVRVLPPFLPFMVWVEGWQISKRWLQVASRQWEQVVGLGEHLSPNSPRNDDTCRSITCLFFIYFHLLVLEYADWPSSFHLCCSSPRYRCRRQSEAGISKSYQKHSIVCSPARQLTTEHWRTVSVRLLRQNQIHQVHQGLFCSRHFNKFLCPPVLAA